MAEFSKCVHYRELSCCYRLVTLTAFYFKSGMYPDGLFSNYSACYRFSCAWPISRTVPAHVLRAIETLEGLPRVPEDATE